MTRGRFILIEGGDRVGKTTQTLRIVDALRERGRTVATVSFPDRSTAIGGLINSHLRGENPELDATALHLLFSANRREHCAWMRETLEAGTDLVVDRYSFSGVAYSMARGLSGDWAEGVEEGVVMPDVMFVLHCDPDIASTRDGYGDERFETLPLQRRVHAVMLELDARKFARTSYALDVSRRTPDDVHEEIMKLLEPHL